MSCLFPSLIKTDLVLTLREKKLETNYEFSTNLSDLLLLQSDSRSWD